VLHKDETKRFGMTLTNNLYRDTTKRYAEALVNNIKNVKLQS